MREMIKLAYYKNKLKRKYIRLQLIKQKLSCGSALASYISSEISTLEREVDELYDKCQALEAK